MTSLKKFVSRNPIVISYIPALHRGYLDFFKKYKGGALYILGGKFIKEHPRIGRDIRALTPAEIKSAVEALGIFSSVEILTKKTLAELKRKSGRITMPDEDLNRRFAKKYLKNKRVSFIKTFLRWDKQISTTEFKVPPDRVISRQKLDRELMRIASKVAEKSPDWWRRIGGVLVKNGQVLLSAYNKPLPSEYTLNALGDPRSNFDAGERIELAKTIHAEAALIAEAAKRGISTAGASLYVTTFPCPVCAKSVAVAGIKKIYYSKGYSLLDAEDILRSYGAEIVLVK